MLFQKVSQKLEWCFYLAVMVSFCYVSLAALYWNRTDPLRITLAALAGLLVIAGLNKLFRSSRLESFFCSPLRCRLLAGGISLVFLVLCMISALTQLEDFTRCDWDIWVIHAEAENIARNPFPERMQYAEYYWQYPNNALLLALFTGWYRLWLVIGGPSVDLNLAAAVLCVMFLWAAQLLFQGAARLFLGDRTGILCSLLWVLVLPFYGYASTPYSDSMSLPFGCGTLFCLAKFYRTGHLRWAGACGVMAGIAFGLKGTFGVLLIAVIIWLFLFCRGGRKKVLCLLLAGLCFVVPLKGFQAFYETSGIWGSPVYSKDEWQIPPTHWLMMAQNSGGPWAAEDVEKTRAFQLQYASYEKCFWACFDVWRTRIEDRGLVTTAVFTNRKVVETWRDGTFQVNQYDRDTYYHPDAPLRMLFQQGSRYYPVFYTVSNAMYFAFLIALMAGAADRFFRKKTGQIDGIFFAQLCMFGMFLLELVWEWRSRYLFGYLPFLILAAPYGISALENGLRFLVCRFLHGKAEQK